MAQAEAIVALGYPAVADHLPDLLVWLQDRNWPGSTTIEGFLLAIGTPVIPHVRSILQGSDRVWQYWVLSGLVPEWPKEMVREIEPELESLLWARGEGEGVEVEAMRLLTRQGLGNRDKVSRAAKHRRREAQSLLQDLDEIDEYLRASP